MYLRIQDFDYELPEDRIATHPAASRDAARLLILDASTGKTEHATFRDIPDLLPHRSLVVLNDTKVIPARLFGRKPSGGRIEVFLIRRIRDEGTGHTSPLAEQWEEMWEVLLRSAGGLKEGTILTFSDIFEAQIAARAERGQATLKFRGRTAGGVLAQAETHGSIPLPPYIEAARRRDAGTGDASVFDDQKRYQTVFARAPGAVAAPTAGLHFTDALLEEVSARGHDLARITLHVGPGTFRPVEVDDPRAHAMDPEFYDVPATSAAAVNAAKADKRPVVAVGTTVVRTLESVAHRDSTGVTVTEGEGSTRLFLMPGSTFQVVTDLITNFHLPRSTLLMLVAAFAGRDAVMAAYEEAVAMGYRFYSYGDAMFIRGKRVAS